MNEEYLTALEKLALASTPGPTELCICDPEMDPIEWYRKSLAFNDSLTVWNVGISDGRTIAVTGNGPDSEANARFIADAREHFLLLIQEVRMLQKHLNSRGEPDKTQTVDNELKPCPFCGWPARLQHRTVTGRGNEYVWISYVTCTNVDNCWFLGQSFSTPEAAAAWWNTRYEPNTND